ncbi:MAG: S8 family serine peptidase [Armatimonadetes bacterium]|nr:S8 family serine peptidase [Armatimonadota bacterium]
MGGKLSPSLHLDTLHRTPYGWPLRQLRVPQAHRVIRGNPDVVVAVIDLGYNPHPHHAGHLWVNPRPRRGDLHGWDCADDDATLEPAGPGADTPYYRDHHSFIVGEVIACAPECRVMAVRVGYRAPKDNWARGIEYAVEHGAQVLVMPHGFISHGRTASPVPLFYRGTDFGAPVDNPRLRQALEAAYDAGCLICCGVIDNRGRRAAFATTALDCVVAVGSSSRHGGPADIAPDADYVEVAAPAGDRGTGDELDRVWSTGGNGKYVASEGGCMAAGFAGGVAALVWSRFPKLTNDQLRQVLRNTAARHGPAGMASGRAGGRDGTRATGSSRSSAERTDRPKSFPTGLSQEWDSKLGWGILDAAAAVKLRPTELAQSLRVEVAGCHLLAERQAGTRSPQPALRVRLRNRGVFDIERALVVVYNGNPERAAAPRATFDRPVTLLTRQLGHAIAPVRGLSSADVTLQMTEIPGEELWVQTCVLDHHGDDRIVTTRLR